jgi:hypothetical protein
MALPGLLFVPLILLLPAAAARPTQARSGDASPPVANPPVWPYLRSQWRPFLCFYGGVGLLCFGIGCVMAFAPMVAIRQMGATQLTTGNLMGTATFTATVVGFMLAQGISRWGRPRVGERLPAVALLGAAVASSCAAAALLLASTPVTLFIGLGVFLTAIMAGTLLFPTAAQELTPPRLRARLVSIMATVNIVLGALGPAQRESRRAAVGHGRMRHGGAAGVHPLHVAAHPLVRAGGARGPRRLKGPAAGAARDHAKAVRRIRWLPVRPVPQA